VSYQISVADSEIGFACEPGETVLDAAERAGFSLPYSCRKGVCNTCEATLVAGCGRSSSQGGMAAPREDALLCCLRPDADLTIRPRRIEQRAQTARKTLNASVFRVARPAPDVTTLHLRFPTGVRAKFRAGQYLQVLLEDGSRRNYSMANAPYDNDGVQLHVRHVAGGRFSAGVLAGLEAGHKLRVELPFGEFFFRDDATKPAILVATGTGFAPLKSIIEDALRRKLDRTLHLYWGARREPDLYLAELAEKWAEQSPHVSFHPVLSEPGEGWRGRTGLVHRAVLADHPALAGYQVYACGNPAMTAAAHDEFVAAGLPEEEFFCDAFVPTDVEA
jgi:CDP-4-dehydro-6-deoxyglucose reductase